MQLKVETKPPKMCIRDSYEVEQEDGEQFWVGGIDGEIKITNNLEVGGAWVEDRNPLSPYRCLLYTSW